jgi:O-acetyl-ADP-ribose deacetylase (regulator of RNase III)
MKVSIFAGDIADADAEAVCTSTNPRLSLVMGTGASIRARGGYEILRACEEIIRDGPAVPGSAHPTTAGQLPHTIAIHCVASDSAHHSTEALIRTCVRNALACAERANCASVAMPIFASGHAHIRFDRAVTAMCETLRDVPTTVRHVVLVVHDAERAEEARDIVQRIVGGVVALDRSASEPEAVGSYWVEND